MNPILHLRKTTAELLFVYRNARGLESRRYNNTFEPVNGKHFKKILSRVCVTIDGVWIGNRIF
jgi:hypothetical protein